jgi:hypothetical protein
MPTNRILQNKFSQEVFKIVLSFILLTGVGGFLSHLWQKDEYLFQARIEQIKYEKEYATTLFEDISKQMERQLSNYKLFLIDSSVKQKCLIEIQNWNENSTRFRALINKYFGVTASGSFVFIDNQFKKIAYSIKNDNSESNLETLISNQETNIYNFNEQLISDLLSENIGSTRREIQK